MNPDQAPSNDPKALLLGLAGALAGGVAGYFIFIWVASQGFYALMLPGAAAGVVSGWLSRDRSPIRPIICAVFAVPLGFFCEWRFAPFSADSSLVYFITHLHQLRPMTLLMIAGGAAFAYWLSSGKKGDSVAPSRLS